ncbi:hypothetical protein niasHS_002298 [Heterodera schachtii]|uniref:FLYWCH-type domain-containing protein n=1 Tax=Heterodera schachtii TaxID=97005 RepID=A0ABD2KJK3_HETSC
MSASCDVKFWRCEFSNARDVRCKGRLHTDLNGNVLRVVGEHVCPSSAARVESQRIITAIKRRAVDTMESTDEILAHALQNVSPSVLAAVPSKNAANKLIKRARNDNKGTLENFKHSESIDSAHSVGLTLTIGADGRDYGEPCHQQQTMRQNAQFPAVVLQTNQQQNASISAVVPQQHVGRFEQRVPKSNFPASSAMSNFDISPSHSVVPIALDSDYLTQRNSVLDSSSSAIGSSSIAYSSPIDNKIEQALDLVKTQLTLAVRKEMKLLRSTIVELEDKVSLLEGENQILRQYAPSEIESNLPSLVQQMRDRQQRVANAHKYSNQQQSRIASSSSSELLPQNASSVGVQSVAAAPSQNSSAARNIWNGHSKTSEIKSDFGRSGL